MNLDGLLRRVKAEDVQRCATLETLNRLCMCFVSNIPFETTDMFGGTKKTWDLASIYKIVVEERRGGFCFDLNGLLQWVLKEFGFEVELLKGYVCENSETFWDKSDHMTLMVTIENGDKYVTDIGWGGSSFTLPLEMIMDVVQSQPNGVYRLGRKDGLVTVSKRKQTYIQEDIKQFESESERSIALSNDTGDGEWSIVFGFAETCYQLIDFQESHDYAQFEVDLLVNNLIVILQNEKGRKFLFNNLFYEKEYINPDTIKLKRFKKCRLDEMHEILEEEFNLKPNFQLKLKTFVE